MQKKYLLIVFVVALILIVAFIASIFFPNNVDDWEEMLPQKVSFSMPNDPELGGIASLYVSVSYPGKTISLPCELRLGEGLELAEGNTTWMADIENGGPAFYEKKIRAVKPGVWHIIVICGGASNRTIYARVKNQGGVVPTKEN